MYTRQHKASLPKKYEQDAHSLQLSKITPAAALQANAARCPLQPPALPVHKRPICRKCKVQPTTVLFQQVPKRQKAACLCSVPKSLPAPGLPAVHRRGTLQRSASAGGERQAVPFPFPVRRAAARPLRQASRHFDPSSRRQPAPLRRSAPLHSRFAPHAQGKRRQQRHATPTAAAALARSFRDASCAFLLLTLA